MAEFKVEPSELDVAAKRISGMSEDLARAVRELAGVDHARNAADSPEVAAAMHEMVVAWGDELGQLVGAVADIGEKLKSASSGYVSTDAQAADWAQFVPDTGRPALAPSPAP
jgi:uncharacterized protein YukE